jgi:molybdopterin-guanine dinucleotide biosynthesis protein A
VADIEGITGIILAGGKSTRLGSDKLFEVIEGETLIARSVRRLSGWDELAELVIVTSERLAAMLEAARLKARIVQDVHPGQGPMGGIQAGLLSADTEYSLVVACDMPFFNLGLIRYMAGQRQGYDVVIPRAGTLIEPLHAFYGKGCLPAIEGRLAEGQPMIHSMLEGIRTRFVEREEVERFDPRHLSFFNINSAADIVKARELARENR